MKRARTFFQKELGRGSSGRIALLSDYSCSSGTSLCPPITEKQLCIRMTELHPKLLLWTRKERWFISCLDSSGQYYLFACIVLNTYIKLDIFLSTYFTVMREGSACGTMRMQRQRTKAYLLVLSRTAIS